MAAQQRPYVRRAYPALSNESVAFLNDFSVLRVNDTMPEPQWKTPPWNETGFVLVYMHQGRWLGPMKFEKIGKGGFGNIWEVTFKADLSSAEVKVILKIQKKLLRLSTPAALNSATFLRECNLITFVYFDVPHANGKDYQHWTVMKPALTDLYKYFLTDDLDPRRVNQAIQRAFSQFMLETLRCICDKGSSYTDMKLSNIGLIDSQEDRMESFKLLDIDSLGGQVASLPVKTHPWITGLDTAEKKLHATIYAFGVTAAIFSCPGAGFLYGQRVYTKEEILREFEHEAVAKAHLDNIQFRYKFLTETQTSALRVIEGEVDNKDLGRLIEGALNILDHVYGKQRGPERPGDLLPAFVDYKKLYKKVHQEKLDQTARIFDWTNALKVENATLQFENSVLQSENSVLESDNAALQADNAEKAVLQANNAFLQFDKATLESENGSLKADKATLQADNATLEFDKAALTARIRYLEATITRLTNNQNGAGPAAPIVLNSDSDTD